jgi:hypothetical protein
LALAGHTEKGREVTLWTHDAHAELSNGYLPGVSAEEAVVESRIVESVLSATLTLGLLRACSSHNEQEATLPGILRFFHRFTFHEPYR